MSDAKAPARLRAGAHVSISGGLPKAIDRAVAIGADCIQIFTSAPLNWRMPHHSDADVAAFRERAAEHHIAPVFIHAPYLLNLASPKQELRERSEQALVAQLVSAERIGAAGVIFHPGSPTGAGQDVGERNIVESLKRVLDAHPGKAALLIETTSGEGDELGGTFEQIGRIIDMVGDTLRLQACLDTAHIFEAGYPIATPDDVRETMASFDRAIGLHRLTCIHSNDSKTPFNSHADRHANIGLGEIGVAGFWNLLHNPDIAHRPLILEVPGFKDKGPDTHNIQLLREIGAAPSIEAATAAANHIYREVGVQP